MAKVLLATPIWDSSFPGQPPLSLLYLAAYVRQFGHKVYICDEPVGDNYKQMLGFIEPDVVGITSPTCGIGRGYYLAKTAKDAGYYTIMGGPHVSSIPGESLSQGFTDAVVIGEGEKTFEHLIETHEKGKFTGEITEDLNSLPLPSFDLINTDFYINVRRKIMNSLYSFVDVTDRILSLMSSRGCPFKCPYCYNSSLMYSTPARYKSAEKTVAEFEEMAQKYKLDAITYLDDDFMLDKKRLEKICELLIEHKNKVYWGCNSRVTDVNDDILEMLHNAGCLQLAFGMESGTPRILKVLEKKATVEQAKQAIELCHKHGIVIQSNFMFGNPTETEEEMMNTLQFMKDNLIDGGLGASQTIPFPETGLWKWCIENNKLPHEITWDKFNYSNYPINMSAVSDEKMKEIMAKVGKFLDENLLKTERIRRFKVSNWKRKMGIIQ